MKPLILILLTIALGLAVVFAYLFSAQKEEIAAKKESSPSTRISPAIKPGKIDLDLPVMTQKPTEAENQMSNTDDASTTEKNLSPEESRGPTTPITIISPKDYLEAVNLIINSVSDQLADLNQKIKYSEIFSREEIQSSASKVKTAIEGASQDLNQLAIDQKYQAANESILKAFGLWNEAMVSFEKYLESNEEVDRQTYSFKIEEGQKLISEIKVTN